MLSETSRRSLLRLSAVLMFVAVVAGGHGAARIVQAIADDPNPIVTENALPGTTDNWEVFDPADPGARGIGDPSIQGFATDISVNRGATVSFKIKATGTPPGMVIDVYRLGYYQGIGARKVGSVAPSAAELDAAKNQPACDSEPSSGLVDCGKWSVTGTFNTSGLTSGVYIARPRRTDTNGASHIVFIVRDDSREADVLFQTSDTTWQAYNQYPGASNGGASLYCGGPLSNAGGDYGCPTRAAKVSYNRPFDTRGHDATSWLFNAEYPMLRWLEANGYNVKYWSGVDTDRFGADPTIGLTSSYRPKAFLSVGHDEYWSGPQRSHVESARNAGVNLAFFSGNEMFWKTRFESSIDGANTSFRTLVSYKETFSNGSARIDPNPGNPWTGTWRDPRFSPPSDGGRPENALTGTIWTVNCCDARITVPASMKNLRFWRNTAVTQLLPNEVYVASPQTVGYEWDEDLDNGARPSGLIRMSSTTADVPDKLLDYGTNVGPGTATHSLTMYRHNSGALVFGAGTVQWSWGLDASHDRTAVAPDQAMQQATVNLLADMGAEADTLQMGAGGTMLQEASMSNDIFAPTSAVTSPIAGSSVASGTRITVSGTASDATTGGGAVAGVEVSTDGQTWHQADVQASGDWTYEWQPGAVGTATIRTRAIDDSGNLESAGPGTTVNIVTGNCPCTTLWKSSAAPTVASAADNNPVELGLKFYSDIDGFITGVRFYKGSGNTGTHVGNLWSTNGTNLATAQFLGETSSGWQQVLFGSPVAITAGTTYVVSYHTNVGNYSADGAYFGTAGVDSPPLHAAPSAVVGGNGLFKYGELSQFPTETFNATNYWVDVVFSPTASDSTPPAISLIKSAIIDSSRVTVTWATDEASTSKVQYSTNADILADGAPLPPGTVTVNAGAFVTAHSLVLNGLAPNTTYYFRIISTDRAGNDGNVAAGNFTLPGPTLRDTSSPDFAAGNGSTYGSETGDGEIILAPVVGTEFSGTTVPSGWISVPWPSGGGSTVANGAVYVDGARLGTCETTQNGCAEGWTLTPGHRLEFVAVFNGDPFQHAGFGQTIENEPWAIFSTGTGNTLVARTFAGGIASNNDVPLGQSYLGAPHLFAIDWRATSVDFYIDGVLVVHDPVSIAGPMRPIAASDFNIFGGVVGVDWMRVGPYAASGVFESRIFDAGGQANWNTIQWNATTPPNTSVQISVRTGNTPAVDGSWSTWQAVAPGPLALQSRYIQYQAVLVTANPDVTPSLNDIIISTGHAPVAVNDSIVVAENGITTLPPTGPGSLTANDTDADNDTLLVVAAGPASHGAVTVLFDGSVRYVPVANYSGPDSFVYTVSDGLMTSSALVTVDVRFGNVPPVANNDFYSVGEDTPLTVPVTTGLLKNDTDTEHDTLTAELLSQPAHGVLTLNGLGGFTYTPNPNFAGPETFTYRAKDGVDYSQPATVQITVVQVNDAPITEADAYTAVLEQSLTITAARGVLANDHDVEVEDTAPLHAQIVSQPANGTLAFNADGSFVYTPNADYLGIDEFTYAAVDHFDAVGNTVTVTITVALKAVDQAVNSGGTVNTGSDVTPNDPLISAVTTPSAATIRIAQGVIAGSQPVGAYTFLNQQVNITILNPDGSELLATNANPIRLAFTIDGSLLLPGETENSLQIFRNGTVIPNCLGQSTIPAENLDPCITAREGGPALNNAIRVTVLSKHASKWNMGLSSAVLGDAPVAQNDGVYFVDFQTPLVVPASGILGNDYARDGLTTVLTPGSEFNGTVDLAPSGAFTFTPAAGACGAASFRYRATDGTNESNEATVSIVIDCTPHANADAVVVSEDSGLNTITVRANDTDPDPGQTLTVISVGPAQHGVASVVMSGQAVGYTPAADYFGSDSFEYTISDGRGGTSTSTVTVTVTSVNDAPSFLKGANQALNEDAAPQSIAGWATGISAGPANEAGQVVSFLASNSNPSLFSTQPAIAANGTLSFAAAPNANGSATVTVRLQDNGGVNDGGLDTSAPQTFTITVASVNDAPSFTDAGGRAVAEDAGPQSFAAWATSITAGAADEASQALTFLVTGNTNPSLFAAGPAISPDGTLSFTPAGNVSGSSSITVVLKDNGGTANGGIDTSIPHTFVISVASVNDAPSFTKGANQSLLEDASAQSIANWATAISAGPNESSQALNFLVSNDNAALFSVQPAVSATGTLTFTPAANAFGVATVSVRLHDDGGVDAGGIDTSAAQTFTITITGINDAPAFVAGANVTVNEDAGAQSQSWATGITAGPNESAQTVSFVVSNSNNALFSTQPAIAPNGTLTFTPVANASGSATVTVRITDNGGVANGGVDSSANQAFTITVVSVNDAPSFVKGANQSVLVDSGAQMEANWATSLSAGPADETSQLLNFLVSNSNTALFSTQPAISSTGTLSYTPLAGATGSATVTVQLHDNGGAANGGIDTSAAQTFTITVMPKPSLAIDSVSVTEGTGANVPAVFTVALSTASPLTTTVNFVTQNGTATSPKDYIAASGTLTFAPGEVSKTIAVNVVGDTTKEKTETFAVALSSPVNATIADGNGLGTILDDDSTPRLQATSTSLVEGTGGQKTMTFAVAPTNGNSETMTVQYTTVAGDNTREVEDFTPVTGTIVFPPESTEPVLVTVPIIGDRRHEKNQKVFLHLMNAIEAIADLDGQGVIEDDDPMPTISIADVTVGEAVNGTVNAVLTVRLSNDSSDPISVRYSTADGSAVAGTDYVGASNVLTFVAGETSHVINITVNAGAYTETIENFLVQLSEATNATIARDTATVSINPPSAWVTSSATEFNLGTLNAGANVTETVNGEITLKPATGAEFSGTQLPAGWTNTLVVTGGTTQMGDGQITLDGTTVLGPTAYQVGRTLEFAATFTGTANQNVGFGVTGANLPPYVMFGVKADGVLYARSITPASSGGVLETPIPGNWFGTPHQFRIDWVAGANAFWIDGVKVATHAVSLPKAASLKPAATDAALGDGKLKVDWMRVSPYATSGVYTSSVYDAGSSVLWQNASFLADMPTGTTVALRVRTAESLDAATGQPLWTAWKAVTSGAAIGQTGRYAQYEVTLQTTATGVTPTVKEVALAFLK